MEIRIIAYSLTFMLAVNTAYGQYHCTIPDDGCVAGQGFCNSTSGQCICVDGFEGYNCGLATDSKCDPSVPSPCKNNGTCYDTDKCFCEYEFYGDTCADAKLQTDCKGTEVVIDLYVKDNFNGQISMTQNLTDAEITEGTLDIPDPECLFVEETTNPPPAGLKHFKFSLPFDGSSSCANASLTALDDTPHENDITYETYVFQVFNTMFTTASDRMLRVHCIHKSSNFSMVAELDAVNLDRKKDVRQKKEDETYKPVKMTVLENNGSLLTRNLGVGDQFKLYYWLADTSVYTNLRVEKCVANDMSKKENTAIFEFFSDGCPVKAASPIMQRSHGQNLTEYTQDDGTVLPATELALKAFKFRGTSKVQFDCKIKICKKGDERACMPRCGKRAGSLAGGTNAAPAGDLSGNGDSVSLNAEVRRKRDTRLVKRSADTEFEELSTVITVVDPFESLPIQKGPTTPATSKDDQQKCFRSQEILVFVIAMSSFVFILLIACIVLSISIIRTRSRLYTSEKDSDYSGSRFSIPRAKIFA